MKKRGTQMRSEGRIGIQEARTPERTSRGSSARRLSATRAASALTYYDSNDERYKLLPRGNNLKEKNEQFGDLCKFKRSLELLGIVDTEKEIPLGTGSLTPKGKPGSGASVTTRLTTRTVSLDRLQEEVTSCLNSEGRIGTSLRKVLSQAVYEEWYFKAMREGRKKREMEERTREESREKLEKEMEVKQRKGQEEFEKWLKKKAMDRKMDKERKENLKTSCQMVAKKRDDSEKAFHKWKKGKDEEIKKKKKMESQEEEKRIMKEKEKLERKKTAERAFQQWKYNTEKKKRTQNAKLEKKPEKNKHPKGDGKSTKPENSTSFLMWKMKKDKEFKTKLDSIRKLTLLAEEQRTEFTERRLLEAQRAFEKWLNDIDCRNQKLNGTNQQHKPWVPV